MGLKHGIAFAIIIIRHIFGTIFFLTLNNVMYNVEVIMNKNLIITNILSVTIAITGTLLAVGCADDKKSSDDPRPVTALNEETWLENTQDVAQGLLEQGRLVSGVIDLKNEDGNEIDFSVDNLSGAIALKDGPDTHVYDLDQARKTSSSQVLAPRNTLDPDTSILTDGEYKILLINKALADGFEGEIHIVSGAVVQQIKDTLVENEFDYDYSDNYNVKAFFKYVFLENTSYSIDEQSGQADVSALAVYYSESSDQVSLKGSFDGHVQFTNDGTTASIQLGDTSSSGELTSLINSHSTGIEPHAINDPTVSFVEDPRSIDPLHLAFDVEYIVDDNSTPVTKRLDVAPATVVPPSDPVAEIAQ